MAGTVDGRVMLFKNGVLQAVYPVNSTRLLDVTVRTANLDPSTLADASPSENESHNQPIRYCIAFLVGLVFVIGDSAVYFYEKTYNGERSVNY